MKRLMLYLYLIGVAVTTMSSQAWGQTANVYVNNTDQSIRGFGGMNFPRWIGDLSQDAADKAFGNGTGQIGLSILRVSVPPNTNDWAGEVTTAQRAKNHGAIVFATPWSPPASMKTNNSTTQGSLQTSSYGAYANHLRDFANYMSSNGASLYAISIQNEPDFLPEYESCGWTGTQIRNFLDNNASVIPTRVIAPETVHYKQSYMDDIASSSQVDILANHAYGGSPTRYNSSKEQWMTEHYAPNSNANSANNWPEALEAGKEIHDYMINGYNAYVWWYIRRSYGLITEDGNVSKRGFVMSHFAKFVRPGYVRVRTDANPSSGLSVSSYKEGNTLVVVAINQSASSQNLTLNFSGQDVTNITKWETTGTVGNNVSNVGTYAGGSSLTNTLSAYSITTFRGTISSSGSGSDFYQVSNRSTGQCLGVDNGSSSNNAAITPQGCESTWYRHQWELEDAPDGYKYLRNRNSDKCMRVVNNEVIQYDCNSGWWSEMFEQIDAGSGYYIFRNRSADQCLRVVNGDLVLVDCNTGWWSQQFAINSPSSARIANSQEPDNALESQLSVFPNPSEGGRFTIDLNTELDEPLNVTVFSYDGKVLFQRDYSPQESIDLNLSVDKGMYLLSVKQGDTKYSRRLIIN